MQDHEQRIIDVLSSDTIIFDSYDQEEYHLVEVGKPLTPGGGECKTDVYALYENMDNPDIKMELKISAKKQNAEFFENKIKPERAAELFGRMWEAKIQGIATQLLYGQELPVYKDASRGEQGIFTLGYRLDLLNAPSGLLSMPIMTSYEDKLVVASGRDEYGPLMSEEKTNPYVNGCVIPNAGIVDYMFCDNDYPTSAQEIYDGLVPVEDYAYQMGDIYCALKAVNYRMSSGKFESRWLAVRNEWFVDEETGLICSGYDTSAPLGVSAREEKEMLESLLANCGITSPSQLVIGENIHDLSVGIIA